MNGPNIPILQMFFQEVSMGILFYSNQILIQQLPNVQCIRVITVQEIYSIIMVSTALCWPILNILNNINTL